jgi:hypothetical protein
MVMMGRYSMGSQLTGDRVKKMNKGGGLKNKLKKAGSLTMIPYALKAAGYDDLADATGYPLDKDGERKPELKIDRPKRKGKRPDAPLQAITKKVREATGMKSGGKVTKMAKGGTMNRGDGCCMKGKTKGRTV